MSKMLKMLFVVAVLGVFLTQSTAYAKPSWNPKGWFKGKKQGWNGESTPPGLSEKEAQKAAKKAKKEARKAEKAAKKEGKKAAHQTEAIAQDLASTTA